MNSEKQPSPQNKRNLFEWLRKKLRPASEPVESKSEYPENTPWHIENRTIQLSSDRFHQETNQVISRMYQRVSITVLPNGDTTFEIPYPFNDILPAERARLLAAAQAYFLALGPQN